ncbi:DUF2254 domain-containing protein [Persicitalea jodogahamensis]|uniref:DUF2254 domain-containing protein n=1 Tax=Persicitalea jodogahamensis TaxID=402147 RepID=A0A8J3GAD5_9BACT|nr:DUF2254 domain-containing protein [Persicitalea jodogahamensis]GHB73400.1 hypothetical protein GCM10007390_29420 [Persicitalea jodogahamensis]
MLDNSRVWLAGRYHKIVNSIAFYPAFIGLLFLAVSYVTISFDFSETGKQIKASLPPYTSLKDASTARNIISAITSGLISLTVFSFSMVMIVLSQAASNLSNRVLNRLIGNRFQQVVLGIYIGTIVYSLFLLSTIRDIDSGIYIPALSTYLLILLTIFDIFLFIYFIHYITQSIKYDVIIHRVYNDTRKVMEEACSLSRRPAEPIELAGEIVVAANSSGIYEGFDSSSLVKIADEYDCVFSTLHTPGTFILKGLPVVQVSKPIPKEAEDEVARALRVNDSESINENFFYGLRQLSEIAMKALSPGINDPGTAIIALQALSKLFAYRIVHFPDNVARNADGQVRVLIEELTFDKMFANTILPVWDYGKEDRLVQHELFHLLTQLQKISNHAEVGRLLLEVKKKMHEDLLA